MDADVDPWGVDTLAEFARALNLLRGGRSYAQLNAAAKKLSPPGARTLPSSTLSDWLSGRSLPTRESLGTFLTVCGLNECARGPWLAAWGRVATADLRRPVGAIRVRESRPRLLGVHASIQVDPATTDLPAYVPRDLDANLRSAINAAAEHGGFVLLIGGSSVGKTRSLYEAVRDVLPEWWLIHPDPADADVVAGLAAAPTPRTVVWLDELQRYLGATPSGLSAGVARRLIAAGTVLTATMWPDEYGTRISPPRATGQPNPHADDRQLLGLARVVDVPADLSSVERRRAEEVAADPRIRIALDAADAGFTQTLAAGPELVRWWENASDPYGKAVITAALDARRIGATAPLTRDFLADAASGYLTNHEQATAPADWLDRAVAYAITQLHGATAALTPVAAGMGRVVGYTAADYLHQHARHARRGTPLPGIVWQALVDHLNDRDELREVAYAADLRLLFCYAEPFYKKIEKVTEGSDGDEYSDEYWGESVSERLVRLLADQGREDELRSRAHSGDLIAMWALVELLRGKDRLEEAAELLDSLAHLDDLAFAWAQVDLLTRRGRVSEAIKVLDKVATLVGSPSEQLCSLLIKQGHINEAINALQARINANDLFASEQLASLLVEYGRIDELRTRAAAGDGDAANRLADLLEQEHDIEALHARAAAGDGHAARRLADVLVDQGYRDKAVDLLRARADGGDWKAARRLAGLLTEQGCVSELRTRAASGDSDARRALIDMLADHGEVKDLAAWADAGDDDAARRLADLLAQEGAVDALSERAEAGDPYAERRLIELLRQQGRTDDLRAFANQGSWNVRLQLVDLLHAQGHVDELRARAVAGDVDAAHRFTDLLAATGRVVDLRKEVGAGTPGAAESWISWLQENDPKQADHVRRFGLPRTER